MVGISLLTLVPGLVGGSETYVRELTKALGRVGRLEYRALVPLIALDAADGLPAAEIRSYPASRSSFGRILAMGWATVRPGSLRREVEATGIGAIHFPLTVMLPREAGMPTAVTVLDLQHEVFPQLFTRTQRIYRRFYYRTAAQRSDRVIVISEHVKETVVERLGVAEERVRVAHLGVDLERYAPDDGPRLPFLLYPANNWPAKNHARLFQAFAELRRQRPDLRLVLTGVGHERASLPAGVESRGYVTSSALLELYRRATLLVFPSLYEGFGQPPLEAMACGCPVAVSTAGALPEVCGDAACYFDPMSVEEMTAACETALSRRDELAARGLERARGFTWDECARRHDSVYDELLEAA
jgi:glycosyltransferase involved in cell wall biosynthesis